MKKAMNLMNRRVAVKAGSNTKGMKANWKPEVVVMRTTMTSRRAERRYRRKFPGWGMRSLWGIVVVGCVEGS